MGCEQSIPVMGDALALAVFSPEQLAGTVVLRMAGLVFEWLSTNAKPAYRAIQRWWGGPVARQMAQDDYRHARDMIILLVRDNDERLEKMRDLRAACRLKYPQYSGLWN